MCPNLRLNAVFGPQGRENPANSCGRGGFSLRVRREDLKTGRFPSPLRLLARQICQRTMRAFYEFMT
jgi:hypothetical protein